MSTGTIDIDRTVEEITEIGDFGEGPPSSFSREPGDDNHGNENRNDEPPVGNVYIAMLLFIGAEVMLFAGLIGAFIVFRFGSSMWPPPLQVRLPVEVTGVTTALLLFSGYTMYRAFTAARRGCRKKLLQSLAITAILGTVFLVVQGYEWIQLLSFGLTLSSGVYGATFYTLIGCHGLHVFGALCWLLVVLQMANNYKFSIDRHVAINLCGMYWSFVVVLWPVLYSLVYLN